MTNSVKDSQLFVNDPFTLKGILWLSMSKLVGVGVLVILLIINIVHCSNKNIDCYDLSFLFVHIVILIILVSITCIFGITSVKKQIFGLLIAFFVLTILTSLFCLIPLTFSYFQTIGSFKTRSMKDSLLRVTSITNTFVIFIIFLFSLFSSSLCGQSLCCPGFKLRGNYNQIAGTSVESKPTIP